MRSTEHGSALYCVSRTEMLRHLTEKRTYHLGRAEHYAKEAEKLDAEMEKQLESAESVTDRISVKNSSNYSTAISHRESARTAMRDHKTKADKFSFFAEHLGGVGGVDEVWLCENELIQLEFVRRAF